MAKYVVRNARLSFPDLFEAVQFQGQGPFQYRASLLVPADSAVKKEIDAMIDQVAKEKWGAKADAILKAARATQKICFIDGDTKNYNGYAGNWALTATRSVDAGKPVVVDRAKNAVSKEDGLFYGGCVVNATVELWAQDNSFGKTVRATLVNIQFVKDGESFGGAAPASDDGLDDLAFEEEGDLY
jgi:hypothetical protein